MKLFSVTCPKCGGKLDVTPNSKMVTCDYCNSDFMIDDEIKRIALMMQNRQGMNLKEGGNGLSLEAEQASVKAMCTYCGGSVIVEIGETSTQRARTATRVF